MYACICVRTACHVPSAILDRQVVLPEQNLPRTQALRVKWGNEGEEGSTMGGWTMFLSRRTTCPRMLLLVGGNLVSPASSGHAHSPTMFWQTQQMAKTKRIFSIQTVCGFSSATVQMFLLQKNVAWLTFPTSLFVKSTFVWKCGFNRPNYSVIMNKLHASVRENTHVQARFKNTLHSCFKLTVYSS